MNSSSNIKNHRIQSFVIKDEHLIINCSYLKWWLKVNNQGRLFSLRNLDVWRAIDYTLDNYLNARFLFELAICGYHRKIKQQRHNSASFMRPYIDSKQLHYPEFFSVTLPGRFHVWSV